MMKHIWNICQDSHPSSWATWAKLNLLCHKSIWDIPLPSDCSWTWRKLLKLQDTIKPFIKHSVGDEKTTFLWFDNWHPIGPLLSHYNDNIIDDSTLPRYAKVDSIIRDRRWHWPLANSPNILTLKESTSTLIFLRTGDLILSFGYHPLQVPSP